MENNFAPYEIALDMKFIGFNEPCFGFYSEEGFLVVEFADTQIHFLPYATAAIYQQAFKWFREKYNLCSWIYQSNSGLYHYSILKDGRYLTNGYNNQTSYELSELECLKKLIEIVKNKNYETTRRKI